MGSAGKSSGDAHSSSPGMCYYYPLSPVPLNFAQDGTMSYFFSLDDVRRLFCGRSGPSSSSGREAHHDHHDNNLFPGGGMGASLVEEELWFVRRQYANRGQKVARRRVWVHGKFRKPLRLGEARGPESLPIPPK